ncbi:MAG: serine/threonine-protein kinase [Verrucomicrobia bacterium]|nr:serine/threonine-protein kinase [Verrucomicrobiota bacterium]
MSSVSPVSHCFRSGWVIPVRSEKTLKKITSLSLEIDSTTGEAIKVDSSDSLNSRIDRLKNLSLNARNSLFTIDRRSVSHPFSGIGHCPIIGNSIAQYFSKSGINSKIFIQKAQGSSSTVYQVGNLAFKLYKHAKKELAPLVAWNELAGDFLAQPLEHPNLLIPTNILYRDKEGRIVEAPTIGSTVIGVLMPYANMTLQDLLRENGGRISELAAAEVGLQIAKGLDKLQSHKILHRDIKPDNIAILNGKVKLIDFSLACYTDDLPLKEGSNQNLCSAPERIIMKEGYSYASDIWSLGVLLYTMVIGRPPFKNIFDICFKDVEFPADCPIDDLFKQIIQTLLSKEPSKRFNASTASQMLSIFIEAQNK